MPKLSVPDQHRLKIARRTLTLSDAGALILGGMTKEEARQVIKELTGKGAAMKAPRSPRKIVVGDRVHLTQNVSIRHFQAFSLATTGTVVRIEDSFYDNRIYVIKFDDRLGEWHYRRDEIRALPRKSK